MRKKYCEECGGEILDVSDENQVQRAILQSLIFMCGATISPTPTYCRCKEGLPPLELGREVKDEPETKEPR